MSIGLRNARIDILRGLSILLVLLHHFNIAYRLDDTTLAHVVGWEAIRAVARNGNYGVTMFFAISGYLITSNARARWGELARVDARRFYGPRIARILPCLLLLLTTVNLLAAARVPIFQNHPQSGIELSFWLVNAASLTFWMNVLIGHAGWFNYALGVLWSLSVEEVFYLAFPLLCIALRRDARLIAFWLVIIAIGPAYRFMHQGDESEFLYAYFASFDGIAIGCCTALLAQRVRLHGSMGRWLQFATIAAMAVLYLAAPIAQTHVLGVTAMALGTAVLLLGAHGEPAGPIAARSRIARALAWFGGLSYELYLFHLIVLGALRTFYAPSATHGDAKLALLAVFLAGSAVLAAAIARGFAEPLNRWLRHRLAGVPARIAAQRG
ncbi:acyltransferase family protein [Burkholderia alba]|uniref:acyltransferase family protein n=1 Tax=Burkholderia alba TaxID=2683677 RepID=UPI002B052E4D|nr:acyltransferase [Burkholderia alba]